MPEAPPASTPRHVPSLAPTTPGADERHPHPPALPPWRNVAAVAAGGAIGGSLRYGFGLAFPVLPGQFPWVVFCENLLGAFALGLLLTLMLDRWRGAGTLRPFLATGVLGSFTTFSNLSLDVVQLGAGGQAGLALLYSAASLALGLAAAFAGVQLGHTLARSGGGGGNSNGGGSSAGRGSGSGSGSGSRHGSGSSRGSGAEPVR